jgi:hypothetical protein
MKRAISVNEIMNTNRRAMAFEGGWLESFGSPERTGSWLIWGNSGNGKTRFALQLAKYLCNFGKVAYNALEEGNSMSMRMAIEDVGMMEVQRRFVLYDKEPIGDLFERLEKKKSPDFVFIDSAQYSGMNYKQYQLLVDSFRHKQFIIVSHADGKLPAGQVARSIRYDSHCKIWVEGYRAFPTSRYGGGKPFTIWHQGAYEYWGEN